MLHYLHPFSLLGCQKRKLTGTIQQTSEKTKFMFDEMFHRDICYVTIGYIENVFIKRTKCKTKKLGIWVKLGFLILLLHT